MLGLSRSELYAAPSRGSATPRRERAEALLARREAREPLAYVLGEWGFRRLTLKTDARALVPRPETEIVVERVLALLDGVESPRVLDVGVGSGAIALAVKDERPDARVTGVDVSTDALALARENAERLGLDVELREQGVDAAAEGWDLVVSNPPYVETLDGLQPELGFEPAGADRRGLPRAHRAHARRRGSSCSRSATARRTRSRRSSSAPGTATCGSRPTSPASSASSRASDERRRVLGRRSTRSARASR